jgi:hypothetical protein
MAAMVEKNVGYEHMREAIGVMTAWASSDDPAFMSVYYNKLLIDNYGPEKAREVVSGLINLCGELLAMRAEEKGVRAEDTLQEIARRIAEL